MQIVLYFFKFPKEVQTHTLQKQTKLSMKNNVFKIHCGLESNDMTQECRFLSKIKIY